MSAYYGLQHPSLPGGGGGGIGVGGGGVLPGGTQDPFNSMSDSKYGDPSSYFANTHNGRYGSSGTGGSGTTGGNTDNHGVSTPDSVGHPGFPRYPPFDRIEAMNHGVLAATKAGYMSTNSPSYSSTGLPTSYSIPGQYEDLGKLPQSDATSMVSSLQVCV